MQKKQLQKLILVSLVTTACAYTIGSNAATVQSELKPAQVLSASGAPEVTSTVPSYDADKWYRDSAERDAIYREVFLLGEEQIQQQVNSQHLKPHTWGVIFDIDETLLDNSKWQYSHDTQGSKRSWDAYAATAQSVALPDAKEFTRKIHQMGGYVDMVTNRGIHLAAATQKNLNDQGIYYDQILFDTTNTETSMVDKNPRFTAIIEGKAPSNLPSHKILAWFGDNIQDFPNLWQKQMIQRNPDGTAFAKFGIIYFALPNPMYGSWEINKYK